MSGIVEAIHVAEAIGAPMRALERAELRAGVGIVGDRYGSVAGGSVEDPAGDRELTLVAGEVVDEVGLEAGATRRNITTRDVDLDALIGREFRIGAVRCRGEGPCEPCLDLQKAVGRPIIRDLAHRGGLRARILTDGEIAAGDPISVE